MKDMGIARKLKRQREKSKRGLSAQMENTQTCQSYYNGMKPMTYSDRVQFTDMAGRKKRATVNFGEIQPNVDSVVGFMAQNRREVHFMAREPDNKTRELYTRNMNALYQYHRGEENADQVETDQDADMIVCGYGATETDLSYLTGNASENPNGAILKMRLDPMRVGWDTQARAKNLLDSRWAYYFDEYDLKDALNLFQGSIPEDFERSAETEDGTGYVYNPYGGLYDKIKLDDSVEWCDKEEEIIRVYNQQWFEYETFYRVANPLFIVETPEDAAFIQMKLEMVAQAAEESKTDNQLMQVNDPFKFDLTAEELTLDERTKRAFTKEFGGFVKPVAFTRKKYYTAVVSGDHVFSWFESISQNGFSIKFKTGIFSETDKIWMGMVNAMIDPQKYRNKTITEILFTIAANSKGGVMVEKSAVEDIADFEGKWAKTDAVIVVEDGAISQGRIMEKAKAAVPTGLENIVQLSSAAIAANGVDPSFLGEAGLQESGVLYKRRIRQVISKLARYFDSLELYQKEDARLHLDLIPVWIQNNNGEWVNITGPDGAEQFEQITEEMIAPSYDVSVQEAPTTPESAEQTSQVLGVYADKLLMANPAAAMVFYSESVSLLPIDGNVKDRLRKALKPQDTVPMQQFQMLQAELERLKGEMAQVALEKTRSEIELNRVKAQKEGADAAETLEKAANTSLENDLVRQGIYDKVSVTI